MNTRAFLKSFFTEHWKYLTVSAACKLNLFDVLVASGKTVAEISKELEIEESNLELVLNGLLSISFLDKNQDKYELNKLSELLTDHHPQTLKYACLNWSGDHLDAWSKLDVSIRTGTSFFETKYGISYFEYLNKNDDKLNDYHNAMFAYAKDDYKDITAVIDFSRHKSVMDVGGGYGALISNIKVENNDVKCFLFDLDLVIDKCDTIANVQLLKGDFFKEIPQLSDAIILSRILHDWNEENAIQILNNAYQALPEKGYLYIIENCIDKIAIDLSLLSLNMLAMCESYERSSYEYIALANQHRFKFREAKKLNELQTILTFTK